MRRLTVQGPDAAQHIIQEEIRKTKDARHQHRLHCILLICTGKSCQEVADLFGDAVRSVEYWVTRFNKGGVNALQEAGRPGRPSRLDTKTLELVGQDLRKDPRELGYSQNLWDGILLSHHLKEKYHIDLKVRQCQYLFHKLGFRRRKPEPRIAKANQEAQEAYKKTL